MPDTQRVQASRRLRLRLLATPLVLACLVAVGLLAGSPATSRACTGAAFPIGVAATRADAIYFVTVRAVSGGANGFYSVDVAPGVVYRGEAQAHVARVVAGEPCRYSIEPSQRGVLLLGVRRPFDGPDGSRGNLFYLLGPGGISERDAQAALGNLPPPTNTADPLARTAVGQSGLAILAAGLTGYIVVFWR